MLATTNSPLDLNRSLTLSICGVRWPRAIGQLSCNWQKLMRHELNEAELDIQLEQLESVRSWGPRVISKFENLLQSEDDFELFRINPIRFAKATGMDEKEAVDLFLHASKVGLLSMNWDMVCSSCASVYGSFKHLQSVSSQFNCPVCKNDNQTSLDDLIHVTFNVTPKVRDNYFNYPKQLSASDYYFKFKLAEGAIFPPDTYFKDALAQFARHLEYIEPGELKIYEFELEPGMLLVRNVDSESAAMFSIQPQDTTSDLSSISLSFGEKSLTADDPTLHAGIVSFGDLEFHADVLGTVGTGKLSLSIKNDSSNRGALLIIVMPPIEPKVLHFDPFLSGKALLSHQTFKDLYRSETIGSGEAIAVKDMSVMFTDLTDSTAMYEKVGDPQAFFLVQQHFAQLKKVISHHNGAIVKTIGDAVMATFTTPQDAIEAALDALAAINDLNQTISENIIIKIGIHRGYCIAVDSNEQQDYFGQTVNIAARVQGLAGPQEVFISDSVYDSKPVQSLLHENFHVSEENQQLKGIDTAMTVHRLNRKP